MHFLHPVVGCLLYSSIVDLHVKLWRESSEREYFFTMYNIPHSGISPKMDLRIENILKAHYNMQSLTFI